MSWIGELWRLPALLLAPAAFLAVPAGIVVSVYFFHRHHGIRSIIPAACAIIGLCFLFAWSPDYVVWILD